MTNRLVSTLLFVFLLGACQSVPNSDEASATFADCLQRNGITVENATVSMGSDGTIEGISVVILSEGDVAYEPTVRLACTEEVEQGS
jgi:hypothetical protein